MSYSWTSSWVWGHTGWANWTDGPSSDIVDYVLDNGKYYYDPNGKFNDCEDGNTEIECSTSIQVGFFGFYNIIAVIIILIGIYYRIEVKKK